MSHSPRLDDGRGPGVFGKYGLAGGVHTAEVIKRIGSCAVLYCCLVGAIVAFEETVERVDGTI